MKKATSILLICGMMLLVGCGNIQSSGNISKATKAIIKLNGKDQIVSINDWDYRTDNGMIKLWLANGGEVVTHSSNVFILNGELE